MRSPRTRSTSPTARPPRDGDAIVRPSGRIDILVNAAGGVRGQVGRPIEEVSEDDWRAIFQANVDGAFWLAQAASAPMRKAGFGRIVNIASGAGLRPSLTGIQAYTAAKHALVGLTKQSRRISAARHHLQRGRARLRALEPVVGAPVAELTARRGRSD
jgi:NAD(P)-dependent dehydrogenase (short-subunit alcohol dehydrogenase family)